MQDNQIPQIPEETTLIHIDKSTPALPQVLFIHRCCSAGIKFFNAWNKENNPEGKVYKCKAITMLNAKEQGLDKKYGFDINDLNKYCYIIHNNVVIKGDN